MVAAHERDRDPPRAAGLQLRYAREVFAGNHGAVLEPEVEQVAVDEEVVARLRHTLEKRVERGLDGDRNLAEMRIGDDDDPPRGAKGGGRSGRHGPQARSGADARQAYLPERDSLD